MLNPALRNQSLARALSEDEVAFAAALEALFASGQTEPAAIAAGLQSKAVRIPGGTGTAWDAARLLDVLRQLNDSLDAAYAERGLGV